MWEENVSCFLTASCETEKKEVIFCDPSVRSIVLIMKLSLYNIGRGKEKGRISKEDTRFIPEKLINELTLDGVQLSDIIPGNKFSYVRELF